MFGSSLPDRQDKSNGTMMRRLLLSSINYVAFSWEATDILKAMGSFERGRDLWQLAS